MERTVVSAICAGASQIAVMACPSHKALRKGD